MCAHTIRKISASLASEQSRFGIFALQKRQMCCCQQGTANNSKIHQAHATANYICVYMHSPGIIKTKLFDNDHCCVPIDAYRRIVSLNSSAVRVPDLSLSNFPNKYTKSVPPILYDAARSFMTSLTTSGG